MMLAIIWYMNIYFYLIIDVCKKVCNKLYYNGREHKSHLDFLLNSKSYESQCFAQGFVQ
jgi:hypothetical protein